MKSNKSYKLIEITPTEYDVLRESGAWVHWDWSRVGLEEYQIPFLSSTQWSSSEVLGGHCKEDEVAFYTRIEQDANLNEE